MKYYYFAVAYSYFDGPIEIFFIAAKNEVDACAIVLRSKGWAVRDNRNTIQEFFTIDGINNDCRITAKLGCDCQVLNRE